MNEAEEAAARARRARIFARRSRAAEAGIHLPSFSELLRLQPFCGNELRTDAETFAARVSRRLKGKDGAAELVRETLFTWSFVPGIDQFMEATEAFRLLANEDRKQATLWEECARRCEYYAACQNHNAMLLRIASYAIDLAHDRRTPDDEAFDYATAAIGWLLCASSKITRWPEYWDAPRLRAHELGGRVLDQLLQERDRQIKETVENAKAEQSSSGSVLATMKAKLPTGPDEWPVPSVPSVVVMTECGNETVSSGKDVAKEFKELTKAKLPLALIPDLAAVANVLNAEFPHAERVTGVILSALVGLPYIRMRPTVLVGDPGCGKTTYAMRLMEMLGIPTETYSCGGISDSSLAGTARRWSSGEPSLPLSLVRRHRVASPGIILDELEKTGTSRHNGSLLDALLSLLEPRSAQRWFDPYVQAAIDLSHVIWLGTANDVHGVPWMLRDRCRVLRFPNPGVEHVAILAHHLLRQAIEERGWDARWATPLTQEELDALGRTWRGGSMRVLARLIDGVLRIRDESDVRH